MGPLHSNKTVIKTTCVVDFFKKISYNDHTLWHTAVSSGEDCICWKDPSEKSKLAKNHLLSLSGVIDVIFSDIDRKWGYQSKNVDSLINKFPEQ